MANFQLSSSTRGNNGQDDPNPTNDGKSSLKRKGYAVKSWKGDASLFFSLHPDATTDTSNLHGSCPAIEGEKWSATKWSHVKSFNKPIRPVEQGECAYENPICTQWAAADECKKNPLYMVGSDSMKGYCRKSCKVC
ncbi:hypothetical protein Droror1_Dr00012251 [Drosera rotundifolia]